jgi:hypothetical protein
MLFSLSWYWWHIVIMLEIDSMEINIIIDTNIDICITWKCEATVGAPSLQETEVTCETIQLQGITGNDSKSVGSANNTWNTLL